jgi:pyrroloquinoline quinone biosynthesis protein E
MVFDVSRQSPVPTSAALRRAATSAPPAPERRQPDMPEPETRASPPDAPTSRPTTLLAELTYRCPLHCPYCSNPVDLRRAQTELTTAQWQRVFAEARALGVLQLGLSGGEPLLRKDLETLVADAHGHGLYTTLVTSGLGLTRDRAQRLRAAGIDHIQISFQDADRSGAEQIAGIASVDKKLAAAALVREMGVAFTVNVVLHRANLDRLADIIELAASLGADRLELANTQYYGWADLNRDALLPTRVQLAAADPVVEAAVTRYRGRMQILYVLPDYYQTYPKACMGGWGAVYLVVAPDGRVLPCQAAWQIESLAFDSVRDRSLDWIWRESPAFTAFRGDAWMRDPCRTCARRTIDFGGCRCQAFQLTGDARNADPVCVKSPDRAMIDAVLAGVCTASGASADGVDDRSAAPGYVYRVMPPITRATRAASGQ